MKVELLSHAADMIMITVTIFTLSCYTGSNYPETFVQTKIIAVVLCYIVNLHKGFSEVMYYKHN